MSLRCIVPNVQERNLEVSEFQLQLRYYVHLRTNAPWRGYQPPQLLVK